jgi:protoheme IX farnesyltransferase
MKPSVTASVGLSPPAAVGREVEPGMRGDLAWREAPWSLARTGSPGAAATLRDYLELTKPRVTLLVLLTAAAGFVVAARSPVDAGPGASWRSPAPGAGVFLLALLGTALVAAGAAALNQTIERRHDARMPRTRERPLAARRLTPAAGLAFGSSLALLGLGILAAATGPLAALVALATLASYVFLYTPLKRKTHLATLIGAVPGALPPLIGWAAAAGSLSAPAWTLFGILFFWQLPHFLAIAWLYRDEYAGAGFPLLTVIDPSGRAAGRQAVVNSLALIPASLLPALLGQGGDLYFHVALALGVGLLALSAWLAWSRTTLAARALVLGSIVYLPALLLVLCLDRGA